ncbi:transglycosylase domain-containing protein, partial [Staphylococcus aureus]|nr:transglycosylase domain-containing protein [Staphylococcus aureus]
MGLFKNKKNEIPQPNSEEVQYRRYQHYYQEPVQPRKRKRISKLFGLVTILIILSIVFYLAVMYMWSRTSDVDDLVKIEDKQSYVQVEDMPDYTKNAFVAVEDKRFYDHDGIDLRGVSRALAVSLKNGELTQGGSTITQQVVKNYFYT